MIGIDIISIKRMQKFYEKYKNKAYERFLNKDEISLVHTCKSAAGYWAAKEATSKALGCGIGEICSFFDIWIHKDKSNKPYITLSKHLVEKYAIKDISLSISHDGDFAIAVVYIDCEKSKPNIISPTADKL